MNKEKYLRWFVEFVSVIAISATVANPSLGYYWLALPIVLMLGVKFMEYQTETSEEYLKIYSQLNIIYKYCTFDREADVRFLFHTPVWRDNLLQTTGYIPTGAGKGRTFSTKKGIIGKAYSQKMTFVENFNDDKEYREKMIKEYEYGPDEIRLRSTDRRSYLCLPLLNDANQKVLGLVYFYSSRPGLYSSIDDPKVQETRAMIRLVRDSIL